MTKFDEDSLQDVVDEYISVVSYTSESYKALMIKLTDLEKLPTGYTHQGTADFNKLLNKYNAKFFLSVVQIAKQQMLADLQARWDELRQQQCVSEYEGKEYE